MLDALALRVVVDSYIGLGEYEKMRDLVARVLPFWTEDMPLYHGVLAWYVNDYIVKPTSYV